MNVPEFAKMGATDALSGLNPLVGGLPPPAVP